MSRFHWRYFLEMSYLAFYVYVENKDLFGYIFTFIGGNFLKLLTQHIACLCCKWCQFSYNQSIIKDTNVKKYLFIYTLDSITEGFSLNLHTPHLTCMGFTRCKCGFDQSLVKGTLLGEQSTSSTSYQLLLQGFSWNSFHALFQLIIKDTLLGKLISFSAESWIPLEKTPWNFNSHTLHACSSIGV